MIAVAFVSLGGRRARAAWLFVIVVVVGMMVVPYAAYGRGGPPDHARGRSSVSPPVGPPLSPPVGPPLSPPVGPPPHSRAAERAAGNPFVVDDAVEPSGASVHPGVGKRLAKAVGRR